MPYLFIQTPSPTFFVACLLALLATIPHPTRGGETATDTSRDKTEFDPEVFSILQKKCFDCHGGGEAEGELKLDELVGKSLAGLANDESTRRLWLKVLQNVRAGTMPPQDGGSKLEPSEIESLANWIKYDALGIDPQAPDPGRITVRRLNRREYSNTIRDLMGVSFDAEILFPPDDTGFGFDNIGDTLTLSPMLIEKYLAAASEIVHKAVPQVSRVVAKQEFGADDFKNDSGETGSRMRMKSARNVERSFFISKDGQYELDIIVKAHGSFVFCPQRCRMSILIDGQVVNDTEYAWNESKPFPYHFDLNWKAGEHQVAFDLVPIPLEEEVDRTLSCDLDLSSVVLSGPADRSAFEHPRRYKDFFTRDDVPSEASDRKQYATELLGSFIQRAFRRPADAATVNKLVDIAEQAYSQPDRTFESGIAQAMIPVLASSRFLFRVEKPDANVTEDRFPLIDEYSLASRLSYFLWATMPDERLFSLAQKGELRANLDDQIDRMLDDDRSMALVRGFVGQWLRTQDVEKVSIDSLEALGYKAEWDQLAGEFRRRGVGRERPTDAPADPEADKRRLRYRELREMRDILNAGVKQAMRRETEMLFEHIAREDRSLIEVIDPGYTFLNESLAKLYGIPDVSGKDMRKVDLPPDSPRGGLLAQGSMLTVTSNPTRTSPVKRGLFILENILGTPTPPAPPNVPLLEDSAEKSELEKPSLRELLALHRESALCASCHSRMDPLGLALEHFNALGMWRADEAGQPIDSSGTLITGESFADVRELRKIIATQRSGDFYRCLTQKMFIFALGRGLDYYDQHTIDQTVAALEQNQGRFRVLIKEIIQSPAFQRQRADASLAHVAERL